MIGCVQPPMKWMLTKDENDQRPFMVILDEFITGTTEQEGHAQRTAQNVSIFMSLGIFMSA